MPSLPFVFPTFTFTSTFSSLFLPLISVLIALAIIRFTKAWLSYLHHRRVAATMGLPRKQLLSQFLSHESMLLQFFPLLRKWCRYSFGSLWLAMEEVCRDLGQPDALVLSSSKRNVLIVNDAELIKEITIKRRKDFPKPEYAYDLLRLFGENIVTAIDDGLWKKHRSLCYPAFSDDNNALVAERTAVNLHRLFKIWETSSDATEEKGKKVWHVDLDNEMVKLALSVIGEAGFGMDLGDPVTADNSKLGESRAAEERQLLDGHKLTVQDALQKVCKNLTLKLILPRFALHLPFERMQEIRICFDEFQRYMKDLIAEKRKLQEAKAKDTTEEVKNVKKKADLLTILTEHATGMTNDEIFGDIFIFLVAGHETTAHTLGWALRLLALYPDKQEKLYKEVKEILGDRDPTYDDYEQLVYSKCVFKESLRLFPQVVGIPKMAARDTTLGPYRIPKDIWCLHRNEKYWDRPLEFEPERFDPRTPNAKPINPGAFVPFSLGRRSCLGAKFSQVEGVTALSMIMQRYRVSLPPDPDIKKLLQQKTLLTLQPANPFNLLLQKRDD